MKFNASEDYKEGYEEGYSDGIHDSNINQEICDISHETGYEMGFERGKEDILGRLGLQKRTVIHNEEIHYVTIATDWENEEINEIRRDLGYTIL